MVRTKQTRLIRCLLYGYKHAKGLVGNIWVRTISYEAGTLTNQSSRTLSIINKTKNKIKQLKGVR